jgi:hypothetical protein
MKKIVAASVVLLLSMVCYSVYNRRVLIPGTKVYAHIPFMSQPRLWANAVEFDHLGWQEICIAPDGKNVECIPLAKASPR